MREWSVAVVVGDLLFPPASIPPLPSSSPCAEGAEWLSPLLIILVHSTGMRMSCGIRHNANRENRKPTSDKLVRPSPFERLATRGHSERQRIGPPVDKVGLGFSIYRP